MWDDLPPPNACKDACKYTGYDINHFGASSLSLGESCGQFKC